MESDRATERRRTDTASYFVHASPDAIYLAFVDPDALVRWLPPEGMTARILAFDPRPGGAFAVELAYAEPPAGGGKTGAATDVTRGRFVALEPDRRVAWAITFESADPALAGDMLISWTLAPAEGGTLVTVAAEHVPPGISKADHDAGLASSLANLARFVE